MSLGKLWRDKFGSGTQYAADSTEPADNTPIDAAGLRDLEQRAATAISAAVSTETAARNTALGLKADTSLVSTAVGSEAATRANADAALSGRVEQLETAQSGSGGGSLMFGQAEASLAVSLPWRAPAAGAITRATVTVADAIEDDPVDVATILLNGTPAATLTVDDGETQSSAEISVPHESGDLIAVERLAVDGGAIQVQLDRGA